MINEMYRVPPNEMLSALTRGEIDAAVNINVYILCNYTIVGA